MEKTKVRKNPYKVAVAVLVGIILLFALIAYSYLKANLVIVDRQDYEKLQTEQPVESK